GARSGRGGGAGGQSAGEKGGEERNGSHGTFTFGVAPS
ncbi:MAG: hypothetical protein QOH86_145, partial [Sphingomonadales bacterium]|nr:hypothetical protein [Sphingomonadales bacterium]